MNITPATVARPSLRFHSTDRSKVQLNHMGLINEKKKKEENVDQFRQVNDITDGDHGSLCYIVNFKEHDFGETVLLL